MKIGIIGAGNIGGNAGRLFAKAGHEVLFSFSRNPQTLAALAAAVGPHARAGTPAEAAAFGDVVMLSVPWGIIDEALAQAGSLEGKIVIDTTNQFGPQGVVAELPGGISAAEYNQRRLPGARLVKAYNTLTSGFQASSAGRSGPDRVVLFYAGQDPQAKSTVAALIVDSGFTPVDMGWATVRYMEAPRRPGAVYGEEFHLEEAQAFVARVAGTGTQ
jgi:predicted dinucleotide-binding enzyme